MSKKSSAISKGRGSTVEVRIDPVSAQYVDELIEKNHLYLNRRQVLDIAIAEFYKNHIDGNLTVNSGLHTPRVQTNSGKVASIKKKLR